MSSLCCNCSLENEVEWHCSQVLSIFSRCCCQSVGQPGYVGGFDSIETRRRFSIGIENPEGLKNSHLVGCPLLVLGQGQTHCQEAPGGAHLVISVLHVASLAGGRGGRCGQDPKLLHLVAHAHFGTFVHLPLGWSNLIWQVSHAWGWRVSATENVWRVWQVSHEAIPKLFPSLRSVAISSGDLI
jgi:hypothetical protein